PEGREGGGPLVDAHVEPYPPVLRGGVQRQRQRRRARAGREHGIGHPAAQQLVDQYRGQCGRRVHRITPITGGASISAWASATRRRQAGPSGLALISYGASAASSSSGRRTSITPSTGVSGSATTSPSSSDRVASPQAY